MVHPQEANAVLPGKPLLRGWFHAGAALCSLPLIVVLCWSSREDLPRLFSLLIFGLSTLALYSVSAIYHIGTWRGNWQRRLRAIDHANIFLVIAGTYTPICFNVLTAWQRNLTLITIWLLAGSGVVLALFRPSTPRWVRTGLYLGMGWVSLMILPSILGMLPWLAVFMLFLGGTLYTLGGVVYGLRWPNPFPRILGFHEIFHLFVIAGGWAFVLAIWIWVLPFPRS
ncbi:MAG: hemolysin III family protein [Chloroflexota bacterium]|nr:hemolysin III family protein [Chloroflexota bacterium]